MRVTVDADLLTRTVENILDNAVRFTPADGSIEIDVLNQIPSMLPWSSAVVAGRGDPR